VEVAIKGGLKVLEESLKLVQMHMKSGHILDKEVAKMILVH